jgi:GTP-binding protein HflX
MIIVFNKMDLYEAKHLDEFLPAEVRQTLLQEMKDSWMQKTNDHAIFISATQNRNTGELRDKIFAKVKELYLERYPYKAGYWHSYLDQSEETQTPAVEKEKKPRPKVRVKKD